MSRKRSDPSRAKARKERIRAEKHAQRSQSRAPGDPGIGLPPRRSFATESVLRQIHAAIEGEEFETADDLNARLKELTSSGQLGELANARKQNDPKWRAQELVYEAMDATDPVTTLELVLEALKLDPACTDAQRLMVDIAPMEPENRISLLREVVRKAEEGFGQEFFAKNTGHFWGMLDTRPYMRALQALAEALAGAGRTEEAAQTFERMLALNPNDNQGVRYALLGLYLALKRQDSAAKLLDQFPSEEGFSATFAWGRVMERWLAGALEEAGKALAAARRQNRYMERYMAGLQQLPEALPDAYPPGDDSEAQTAAADLAPAIQNLPEFVAWLQMRM